jgi:uncharacterized protein
VNDNIGPMEASRGFQIFAKPAGGDCNLACGYCYYLDKGGRGAMDEALLESYIAQHIAASPDEIIRFSWHGGEPTLLGLAFFRKVVSLQRKHVRTGRRISNGLQTNGTLLDADWARFLAEEKFSVGLSLDGPRELHDLRRKNRSGRPSFKEALRGYDVLRRRGVQTDILCVVGAHNAARPEIVYRFFRSIDAPYVTFLPLVHRRPGTADEVDPGSVASDAWGEFLCAVFDEWVEKDIGRIKIQIFEEAARVAFGQEHSLCIFRPVCGDILVLERDGAVYACDHFVDEAHRLGDLSRTPLLDLIESPALRVFGLGKRDALPRICRECEVLDMCRGECPKNRFLRTPDGETGWNFLCSGYRGFFNHCRPFVEEVGAEWRRGNR